MEYLKTENHNVEAKVVDKAVNYVLSNVIGKVMELELI
tara:strand:- start:517 stop:630 length:114 start_codon:yes stop_codon:yes gene_type:complete